MSPTIEFGTDGIRGPVGEFPLDDASIQKVAIAIANFLDSSGTVAIAMDTRESGPHIVRILIDTLLKYGINVLKCGVLPTAALACVVVEDNLDLGIVVTASHNPWSDNGIKLFNSDGEKFNDTEQNNFEQRFFNTPFEQMGILRLKHNPQNPWIKRLPTVNLKKWSILLDCANGAAAPYAGKILRNLGATVTEVACNPNGQNINLQCGALHPPLDIGEHDIAICFDGDADRLVMVNQNGILDGDDFLILLSSEISGPLIGTVMSNGGLDNTLGSRLQRSKVGDKNVLKLMVQTKSLLGAEPSGHIIFRDGDMPTGDGLYAALRILSNIKARPINCDWIRWPTHQQSIRFTSTQLKPSLENWNSIDEAKASGHRLVVRYSGTESKLRVLVEGPKAEYHSNKIAKEFHSKLSP